MFGQGSAFSGFGVTVSAETTAFAANALDAEPGPLARPASSFHGFRELAATIYSRTSLLLQTLANVYGKEGLLRSIHRYALAQRFQHPEPDALIGAFEAEMGHEVANTLRTALETNGWVDYRVAQLSTTELPAGRWTNTVVLERLGTLAFPISVSMKLKSGETLSRRWLSTDPRVTWNLVTASPVEAVNVDPEGAVLLETERQNNARFLTTPPHAWTLLERIVFWTDSLL